MPIWHMSVRLITQKTSDWSRWTSLARGAGEEQRKLTLCYKSTVLTLYFLKNQTFATKKKDSHGGKRVQCGPLPVPGPGTRECKTDDPSAADANKHTPKAGTPEWEAGPEAASPTWELAKYKS